MELISEFGFRQDGRKPNELRRISAKLGFHKQADGSAYLEQGQTKVLAAVYGPHEVRRRAQKGSNKCIINCQYSMATFSTTEHKLRPQGDRKSIELTAHIQKTFESAILIESYPRAQIDIFCKVLQADGGNLAACINAATLALVDAGVAMRGLVSACSVGSVEDKTLVDASHNEDSASSLALTTLALLPRDEQIVLLEMTNRLHFDLLENTIDVGIAACKDVHAVLDSAVRNHVGSVAANLGWE